MRWASSVPRAAAPLTTTRSICCTWTTVISLTEELACWRETLFPITALCLRCLQMCSPLRPNQQFLERMKRLFFFHFALQKTLSLEIGAQVIGLIQTENHNHNQGHHRPQGHGTLRAVSRRTMNFLQETFHQREEKKLNERNVFASRWRMCISSDNNSDAASLSLYNSSSMGFRCSFFATSW